MSVYLDRVRAENARKASNLARTRVKTKRARKGLKKQSKAKIATIQRALWVECRRIAKTLYPNDCYTCSQKNLQGSNCQLGHFIHRSVAGAFLKYDLRNMRFQCFMCNMRRGGMGAEFGERLERDHGKEYVTQLFLDKQKIVKAYPHYEQLLQQYKEM